MTDKILPCPFCGNPCHFATFKDGGQVDRYDSVGCSGCFAEINVLLHWAEKDGTYKDKLVQKWNTRVKSDYDAPKVQDNPKTETYIGYEYYGAPV